MNVFEVLKQDHQKARTLFSKLEETSSGAKVTREKLFNQLKDSLLMHAKAEEKLFYPKINKDPAKDQVKEAYDEHHEVEALLKKMGKMAVDSDQWMEQLHQLKDMVEHHVKEEEEEIFKQAQKMLGAEQIEKIGDDVKKFESH